MPAKQNKAIVRRLWEEAWNQKRLAVCDEIFDETYATHEKGWATYVFGVIPDIRFDVEDMIAEEDKVVTRLTISGAHQGEFLGAPGTGKTFSVSGMWIHRLENGRIVEGRDWGQWDALGFLQQVGAAPTPSS